MNPKAQITAMLKASGRTFSHEGVGREFWFFPDSEQRRMTSDLPKFLKSRDAAVEALIWIAANNEDWSWGEYEMFANITLDRNHWEGLQSIITMTAAQITEAILRTLRLWVPDGAKRVTIISGAWRGVRGHTTGPLNSIGATPITLDTGIALAWHNHEFTIDDELADPSHNADCQLGDNWKDCQPCVEQFNETCLPEEILPTPEPG